MEQVQYDISYQAKRSRIKVLLRGILIIPHFVLWYILSIGAGLAGIVHWFAQVITGKRVAGIFTFANNVNAYTTRVMSYTGLMFDEYPGWFEDGGKTPTTYSLGYVEKCNRLTVLLRIFWMIPAIVIAYFLLFGAYVVLVVAWFAIVITGKFPRGMFDFSLKVHRYMSQYSAYSSLLTDQYPKFG